MTMEDFLASLDMTSLKTVFENDSDYGEEEDMGMCHDKISQSGTSFNCSQSAKSNIKSPKNNAYKKPAFQT